MSQFRMDRGFRELYLADGGELRQTSPQPPSPVGSQGSVGSPQYKMGTPIYRSGVYVARDNTRPPRPVVVRTVDPAYVSSPRTHITYKIQQDNYCTSVSPNRESPPPPPYSPPRHSPSPTRGQSYIEVNRGGSPSRLYAAVYRSENAAVPQESAATYQNLPLRQRSPSPFQERKDIETLVPTYSTAYAVNDRFPTGAPSKIVYSSHQPPQGHGQVSSKPMSERDDVDTSSSEPQPTVPSSIAYKTTANDYGHSPTFRPTARSDSTNSTPRPYQLKPTMDSYSEDTCTVKKPLGECKEAEVDALTNLLIQNMEVSGDPDFFGQCSMCGLAVFGFDNACQAMDNIYHAQCFVCAQCGMCVKCGRAIMGDNSGCSALDQLFHIECFTCATCAMCLKGHQFFAMEGKPYCEPCYMNTLEKCSVCSKPITDRILRATGKPYHPTCFTCVVCGKSLDRIQFTVDATNQIHCIQDFHKKFAPRCCVCDDPIMPDSGEEETVRIVAMDRSFHVKCYKCEDCGLRLSSEADGRGCYPLDDNILCKQCNAKRIQAMTTRMMTEL